MKENKVNEHIPNLELSGICGLFCLGCPLYIFTNEEPERLKEMAQRLNRPIQDLQCQGCRTTTKSYYCKVLCKIQDCAKEKGVDFCSECSEYPCKVNTEFQAELPHRIEVLESLDRIKEVGYKEWYEESLKHYSCNDCNTLNSCYDMKCRKCGATPSCGYIENNKEEIIRRIPKSKKQ